MRHRTKTLTECSWCKIVQSTSPKTGRKVFTVRITEYMTGVAAVTSASDLRKHFDPGGNRGSLGGLSWKFKDRKTAEQLVMAAILKFGG